MYIQESHEIYKLMGRKQQTVKGTLAHASNCQQRPCFNIISILGCLTITNAYLIYEFDADIFFYN